MNAPASRPLSLGTRACGKTEAGADRTRGGRGPHNDRIQSSGRGPDAGSAVSQQAPVAARARARAPRWPRAGGRMPARGGPPPALLPARDGRRAGAGAARATAACPPATVWITGKYFLWSQPARISRSPLLRVAIEPPRVQISTGVWCTAGKASGWRMQMCRSHPQHCPPANCPPANCPPANCPPANCPPANCPPANSCHPLQGSPGLQGARGWGRVQ
eukprot:gene15085-biopygen5165